MNLDDYDLHRRIPFIKAMRDSGRNEVNSPDLQVNVALERAIKEYADHYGITFQRACTLIGMNARY
jgi:hypothetical protein